MIGRVASLVVWISVSLLSMAPLANASGAMAGASTIRVCSALFSAPAPAPALAPAPASISSRIREIQNVKDRWLAPAFRLEIYNEALKNYQTSEPSNVQQPKTREETLAFLTFVTKSSGRNPYDLELLARSQNPAALSKLIKTFGRIDSKSISPTQIDDIFEKIRRFAEPNPNTLLRNLKQGLGESRRLTLEQWATKEIASHNTKEAFERLGLLEDARGLKSLRESLKAHPNALHAITSSAFDIFLVLQGGLPLAIPEHSRLQVTRLEPELRALIETEGFDAAYPILKARYGKSAAFDQAFFWARRALTSAMMAYVICAVYPAFIHSLAPFATNETDSTWTTTKVVLSFYVRLAHDLIASRFDRSRDADLAKEDQSEHAPVTSPGGSQSSIETNRSSKPKAVKAVAQVDDTKTFAQPVTVKKFGAEDATPAKKVKVVGDAADEKELQSALDSLDNMSFADPTTH